MKLSIASVEMTILWSGVESLDKATGSATADSFAALRNDKKGQATAAVTATAIATAIAWVRL
ncbi:hypothetical protein RBB75_03170 [Tunturibacter empetritectus]|uniref:Uncharacterized protein n=1 Tax=Tunturiibacter empetritectus TaxID=3069691 RepID=A0AAU7ZFL5_9BACT